MHAMSKTKTSQIQSFRYCFQVYLYRNKYYF